MRIASIVSAVALMAIATAGSALAAEPFATLEGVTAESLSPTELASVQGSHIVFIDDTTGDVLGGDRTRGNVIHGRHITVTISDDTISITGH